jgi:hypothetical protein
MSYRVAVFLIFVALMVRAVVRSRQKWVTGGLMLLSWLAALALASLDPTYRDNGAAAWEAWGLPSLLIPTIAGSIHARYTRRLKD